MSKNRVKIGIATLAMAGAGVAVPFAATGGAGAATATPAIHQHGLVNVAAKNLLNHNRVVILKNVQVPVAAAVCNVNAAVLSRQLNKQGHAFCPALSRGAVITQVFPA